MTSREITLKSQILTISGNTKHHCVYSSSSLIEKFLPPSRISSHSSKFQLSFKILCEGHLFHELSLTVLGHTTLLSCPFSSKLVPGSYFGGPHSLSYFLCILLWCFNISFYMYTPCFLIRLKLIQDKIEFPMETLTELKTSAST